MVSAREDVAGVYGMVACYGFMKMIAKMKRFIGACVVG
jgi:hypothetical protein